jgi:hypothetical protein
MKTFLENGGVTWSPEEIFASVSYNQFEEFLVKLFN